MIWERRKYSKCLILVKMFSHFYLSASFISKQLPNQTLCRKFYCQSCWIIGLKFERGTRLSFTSHVLFKPKFFPHLKHSVFSTVFTMHVITQRAI